MASTGHASSIHYSRIHDILRRSDNAVDICATFVLLWLARASNISSQQALDSHLDHFYNTVEGTRQYASHINEILDEHDIGSFIEVCQVLRTELTREESLYLLELGAGVAMLEGDISVAANHIFRLLVDLFGLDLETFKQLFLRATNRIFPEPGDPSSPLWWEFEEQSDPNQQPFYQKFHGDSLSRTEALKILGLDPEATPAEIKTAYQRLVQHYHPDRHGPLDPESAEKARHAYRLVRRAWEVLKG